MSESQAVVKQERRSLVATIAAQYDMEPQPFLDAIQQTVMPSTVQVSNAMTAAFLLVCNEHGLNPFTREIFAFPTKTGGIQPIVSIDGWVKLVNQHPQFAGMDIQMQLDEKTGKPVSCTCTIFRKDREHATPITEYFDECYRNTDPWNKMPKRMMRHKALKEAARYTFGFAGIMDEDEGRDAINITNESTEMERSTVAKTSEIKKKIESKKAEIEKQKEANMPEQAAAVQAEPQKPEATPQAQATPAPAPSPEVVTPAAEAQPDPLVTEANRKEFVDAATKRAAEINITEAQAKAKIREIICNAGATKFLDLKQSQLAGVLQEAKTFTV